NVTTLDSSVNYQTHLPNAVLPELGQPNAIEYQSQVEPLKTLPSYQSAVQYQAFTEQPSVSPLDSSIRYQAQLPQSVLPEVAQPSPVEYQSQLQTLNGLPQYHSLAQYKAEFAGAKAPELGGV
ncbi:hypothetical protein, partial [Vibrio parahaemolyticus]